MPTLNHARSARLIWAALLAGALAAGCSSPRQGKGDGGASAVLDGGKVDAELPDDGFPRGGGREVGSLGTEDGPAPRPEGGETAPPPPPADAPVADARVADAPCGAPDDVANCGRCGNVCPRPRRGTGEPVCRAGQCELRCTGNQSVCGDGCVNLQSELTDCGACGRACSGLCVAGACQSTWDSSQWDLAEWGP